MARSYCFNEIASLKWCNFEGGGVEAAFRVCESSDSEKCNPLHNKTIIHNWKGPLLNRYDNHGQEAGIVHSAGRLLQPSPGREGNQ